MRKTKVEFLPKEPILTPAQLDKTSDIFIAVGQLSAAFMVLPFVIPGLDRSKLIVIAFGLVAMIVSWTLSVLIARKIK